MGSTSTAALLLLLAAFPAVLAVTYQVGDTDGWNNGVDYTAWASGKTFKVGDTLEFKYGPFHTVTEVDKSGFDNCDESGSTTSFSDGDTKIVLKTVGTMHFICTSPGHCVSGMKLAVPVLAASPTPTTPTPPSPKSSPKSPPKHDSTSPSASPPAYDTPDLEPTTLPPPPLSPNAASKGIMSYGVIGITMVLMYGFMTFFQG